MNRQQVYQSQLGVFAKYWQPGKVKTRLAVAVGENRAAELYLSFLKTTLKRFANVADRSVLCYSPIDRKHEFQTLLEKQIGEQWILTKQADGDLGNRMKAYFTQALMAEESIPAENSKNINDQNAYKVVLIGSDSPTLPIEYVQQAFDWLDEVDLVLGPTDDGGYYLVAAKRTIPPIFDQISWSTPQVWQQTVDCLESHQVKYNQLPLWYDIDEEKDLSRLEKHL